MPGLTATDGAGGSGERDGDDGCAGAGAEVERGGRWGRLLAEVCRLVPCGAAVELEGVGALELRVTAELGERVGSGRAAVELLPDGPPASPAGSAALEAGPSEGCNRRSPE